MRTRHRTRGRVAAIAALAAAVLLLGGGWALYTRNDDASEAQAAAKRYLGAWSRGADGAAAKLTHQPREAAAALTASRRGLDGARVHAVLQGDVDEQDGRATAPVAVAWRVPGIGSFAYRTTLRLARRDERWVVRWSPRAVHPRLGAGTRLGTSTDAPASGRILARDGRAIVKPRAVVDVAVEVAKVRDPAETARGLAAIDGIDAAADFGLGRKLALGLPAADAKVLPPTSKVGQAAMMIGQDRIVASPLAMAGVAATVAAGRWNAPRLLRDDPRGHGPALRERDTLRPLMRDVVTSGTGTRCAEVPGPVIGESGTAEYGGGDPPPTHAWFMAARDDVAVAVLVEGGRSGGTVAAPIAARFPRAL